MRPAGTALPYPGACSWPARVAVGLVAADRVSAPRCAAAAAERRPRRRLGHPRRGAAPPPPPAAHAGDRRSRSPRSATAPTPDPRPNLKAGRWDAEQAAWNMRMLSTTPPPGKTLGATHSDLAFSGNLVIQGNYNGFEIYDISNPSKPTLVQTYLCPASQNDVSVYRNLVFMSSRRPTAARTAASRRPRAGQQAARARHPRLRHLRHRRTRSSSRPCRRAAARTRTPSSPRPVTTATSTSTCPGRRACARPRSCRVARMATSTTRTPRASASKSSRCRWAHPEQAAIVSSPRIFQDLPVAPSNEERARRIAKDREAAAAAAAAAAGRRRGAAGARRRAAAAGPAARTEPVPRHHRVSGDRSGRRRVRRPRPAARHQRSDEPASASTKSPTPNMSFWHSATFNNDGTKMLFTDEWGGGSQPRCRATDKLEWGANALFTIENNEDEVPRATTSCRRRSRRWRTASRTTDR